MLYPSGCQFGNTKNKIIVTMISIQEGFDACVNANIFEAFEFKSFMTNRQDYLYQSI